MICIILCAYITYCLHVTLDGPGSTSEPDSVSTEKHEEDAAEMDLDPEATSDLDESSSDDSDDSDEVSDPELTSDLDDRSLVLEAAMLHVPSLGWTPAALEEGVRDEGLSLSVKELFPRYIHCTIHSVAIHTYVLYVHQCINIVPWGSVCDGKLLHNIILYY